MPSKHTLIRGAFILTAAGFISRFMGFFFRIFLSHAFGEENVGLYQLIFPVYALCHSVSTAGIETALSRTVARKISLNRHQEAKSALFAALFFTVSLSAGNYSDPAECIFYFRLFSGRQPLQRNVDYYFLRTTVCRCPLLYLRLFFRASENRSSCRFPADRAVCPYCLCHTLFSPDPKKRQHTFDQYCCRRNCRRRNILSSVLLALFIKNNPPPCRSLSFINEKAGCRTPPSVFASDSQPDGGNSAAEYRGSFHPGLP